MVDKKFMDQIRIQILEYSKKRRDIIRNSSDIQLWSKKAIFAMQRDQMKEAKELLGKAKKMMLNLAKKYKTDKKALSEGSYKAATEEYVEAVLFSQFLEGKELGKVAGMTINQDIYIGGLCDVPGEMLRYAIKSATERNFAMVKKCFQAAEDIIGVTMDMNLTGYNRQKFDQAKGALNKLQHIAYETSMKE